MKFIKRLLLKYFRWFGACLLMFIEHLLLLGFRFCRGMSHRQMGTTKIICSKDVVGDCNTAMNELKAHSTELYQSLANANLVLCFHSDLRMTIGVFKRHFVGKNFIDFGVRGFLSFFVSVAYVVQAGLHRPAVAINDGIDGGLRRTDADAKAAAWMKEHP